MARYARILVPVVALAAGVIAAPVSGVPAAATAVTSTSASRAGIPWTAEDVSSGVSAVAQPNAGCSVVDVDGFCVAGVWPRIDGARWIWRTASVTSDEAVNGTVWVTFTDTFTVPSLGTTTLQIAADDQYEATLNGSEVASGAMTVSTYPVTPVVGLNTITVRVRSLPGPATPYESPAGATWKVTSTWDSGVSLTASAASVPVGGAVTLNATLATGPTDRHVTVYARPAGGSESVVGSGLVPVSGALTVTVRPARTTTYVARFAGEGSWPAAESAPVTVRVLATLTLAASRRVVSSGAAATLTARLTTGSTQRRVLLYASKAGARATLIASRVAPSNGVVTFVVRPLRSTAYTARSAGDAVWTVVVSRPTTVAVASRWTARSTGGYATSGGYRLYHWSRTCRPRTYTGCPSQVFVLTPAHARAMVEVTFQYRWGGRWVTTGTYRWALTRASAMPVFTWYDNTWPIGVQQRTMARFTGDAAQAAAGSSWLYWKVTR